MYISIVMLVFEITFTFICTVYKTFSHFVLLTAIPGRYYYHFNCCTLPLYFNYGNMERLNSHK